MKLNHSIDQGELRITLTDDVTFEAYSDFKRVMDLIKDEKLTRINIDMAGVAFMDSSGLGLLLLVQEESKKKNIRPRISGATGQINRLFELARFEQYFDFA